MYRIISIILLLFIGCDDNITNPLIFEDDMTSYRNDERIDNFISHNYLNLSINKEDELYITEYILPNQAPYVMEIEVIAKTNLKHSQKLNWYTDKEYVINECPDYWECPYIFDLMQDSVSYVDSRGISKNSILVSPEFIEDTIHIYSYFVDKNDIYYRDTLQLFLTLD